MDIEVDDRVIYRPCPAKERWTNYLLIAQRVTSFSAKNDRTKRTLLRNQLAIDKVLRRASHFGEPARLQEIACWQAGNKPL